VRIRSLLYALPFAILPFSLHGHAQACAPAPPQGAFVGIAGEAAIIVWDEATKTEHFIRRATFQSDVKDFGFLVPTPDKPELAVADDISFVRLEDATRPEMKYERTYYPSFFVAMFFMKRGAMMSAPAAAVAPVRVLEETRVAGYDAVVLEADDPAALAKWLADHGYDNRPALTEWLAPYVAKKWKLTAFKIAPAAPDAHTVGTQPVRMSFKTDRPLFPYREPRDQREGAKNLPRSLGIAFVGPWRAEGTIGDGKQAFPGTTTFAAPLDPRFLAELPGPKAERWLTVFEDDSSPRPGVDDLWLDRAKDPSVVRPPPWIRADPVGIPVDLIAILGGVVLVVVLKVRKRPASTGASRSE
jgi:hypothetical protein